MPSLLHLLLSIAVGIAAVIWFYANSATPTVGPTVSTSVGKYRGIIAKSREGRDYYQFLGIKYAQPPTAQFRFEEPRPVPKFEGIFEANKVGVECLQFEYVIFDRVIGDEDCLSLNVYVPKIAIDDDDAKKSGLAVMVYVHGGIFMLGSSTMYKGGYFVDENIILVSINYRLGALGFLSSGEDGVVRGNNAMRDQILALKWVQDNIKFFGGDPKKVTLFGESAGGASTHHQMISSQSANLFSKVISMSGTAYRNFPASLNPRDQFKNFAQKFNCPTQNSTETLQCLKDLDGHILVKGHEDAADILTKNQFALFAPSIEGIDDSKTFLEKDAKSLVKSGNYQKIPWINGVVQMEGLLYVARLVRDAAARKEIDENWLQIFPKLLKYDDDRVDVTRRIKNFYFGQDDKDNNVNFLDIEKNIEKFSDLFSDRLFIHPAWQAARDQSKFSPVFVYYLTYKPKTNIYALLTSVRTDSFFPNWAQLTFSMIYGFAKNLLGMNPKTYGPGHGDELSLLFDLNFLLNIPDPEHVDYQFSKMFTKLWADWAKGNETAISFNGHSWLPVNPKTPHVAYMELDMDGKFQRNPQNEEITKRMTFWDSLNL